MKFLSVCIPTYEMHGLGGKFLKFSFDILVNQTFKDFEVVISDHSSTDMIKNVCDEYKNKLDINYYKNPKNIGNSSANINEAIKKSNGLLIKILFQDDFLYNNESLEEIIRNFDLKKDKWMISACEHTIDGIHFLKQFYPKYHDKIHIGKNTISSPSVLTIKNENPLLFDEKLIRRMDTDYYKRCYDKFGDPKILNSINIVNRIGPHQISNTLINDVLKDTEYKYILKKYNEKNYLTLIFFRTVKGLINKLKKFIKRKI